LGFEIGEVLLHAPTSTNNSIKKLHSVKKIH